ncbi:unnamed protein product [Paramecium sonneborni]|uniref:Uncharacterized protein n=1 Tax=Paramecium sonneborni TaxID=65129 RepID=A0A8S1NCM7_9CILI|nr:unnamed protein product [Paramecium sonneborni]
MSIRSIREKQWRQSIFITYQIAQGDCLLEIELMSKQINFSLFSSMYLLLEAPFQYFKLEYQENGFISMKAFLEILKKVQNNPIQGASSDVINKLLEEFEQIEEDLNQRLIHLYKFSDNPQFLDKNTKNQNDGQLLSKIKEIDQKITDTYKIRNPKWQLLYVVETTATQIWNGEEKKIIKLGKTDLTIQNYVAQLKKNYQGKIEFQPLFAQRLYTPGTDLVDRKYFHKKLLESIPNSKLYLKANESEKSQIHYEFYYLTQEFVQNFEKLLHQFIDKHKSEYNKDQIDEKQETQAILQQQNQEQTKQIVEQKKEEIQILQSETEQSESDKLLDIIQKDETLNENTNLCELSSSLDDENTFYNFFSFGEKTYQKLLGIPVDYELSEENEYIVTEASKMVNSEHNLLKGFLFLAAVKRQMAIDQ